MKILRKIIGKILIISIFMNFISMYMVSGKSTINPNKIINVSVLLYKGDDKYINKVKMNLEKIQEKNKDKINYKFYDGEEKQSIQNSQLEQILKEGTDLILLNIVDIDSAESVINRIKMSN
ncbi:substrate-binding domain-containing protein, partial [Clostridium butyricum]